MNGCGARALGLGAALALAAACGGGSDAAGRPTAPAGLSGGIVIEPPLLEIGETARVEIAVVTPPEHRVAPLAPPEGLEGVWVLASETPRVERSAGRWVHRLGYQVRARATGHFAWPAQQVSVTAPDGSDATLDLEERPFEVAEVTPEYPEQEGFFSYRAPGPEERAGGSWLPALAGSLATLALLGLVALVRRVRGRNAALAAAGGLLAPPAGRAAQAALAGAAELAREDAVRAGDMASAALRLYAARRFGLPALVSTTEELVRLVPASGLAARRWPELLPLLRTLDGVRFRRRERPEETARVLADAIAAGQAWVASCESLPGGASAPEAPASEAGTHGAPPGAEPPP